MSVRSDDEAAAEEVTRGNGSPRPVTRTDQDRATVHPVLDQPIVEDVAQKRRGMDWVVFGVTAAIAVGFLLWGFLSTDTLASASGSALTWVMDNIGWFFVLTASGFVVFVLWLAIGRYGNIPWAVTTRNPSSVGCPGSP